jgi:hypothetical protein
MAAPGVPAADEPWRRTSNAGKWRAYRNGFALTVTRVAFGDGFQALVEGPGVTDRSPIVGSLAAVQEWADNRAGDGP